MAYKEIKLFSIYYMPRGKTWPKFKFVYISVRVF